MSLRAARSRSPLQQATQVAGEHAVQLRDKALEVGNTALDNGSAAIAVGAVTAKAAQATVSPSGWPRWPVTVITTLGLAAVLWHNRDRIRAVL